MTKDGHPMTKASHPTTKHKATPSQLKSTPRKQSWILSTIRLHTESLWMLHAILIFKEVKVTETNQINVKIWLLLNSVTKNE